MKVGALTLMIGLMLAWPALAGTEDPCVGPDTDSDGTVDICDNCSADVNPTQTDGDQDGYGDACDCDYSTAANNACDGVDFGQFGLKFGTLVPPTNCEYDHVPNGAVDGVDLGRFGTLFGKAPGPACTNPLGTPCNGAICGNAPGVACPGAPCP